MLQKEKILPAKNFYDLIGQLKFETTSYRGHSDFRSLKKQFILGQLMAGLLEVTM